MAVNRSLSTLPDLDEIYKNLLQNFDPASKRLVQAGRELLRAWLAVSDATRAYVEALERLGLAGTNCGGETKEIGQCLLQISGTLKELHKQEKNTIQFYESQVLVPTDANLDQDSKVLVEQRKNFEKKLKQLGDRVKRDRKKGVPTEESERMFRDYQTDCVKQALTEEKKRYTYMLDRHCALASWQYQFYRNALTLYEQNIQKWKDACVNPEELSAAALAALDAAIQPYATQSSVSTVTRPAIRTISNSESDAISNSLPSTPLVREQGVGTFHINEGESVKATLDAAKVALQQQNQQRPETVIVKNGETVDRNQIVKNQVDPPSTGSSTLSNGSRYQGEPTLNGQQRATSMSSLVKKTDSSTQVAVVSTNAVIQNNGNAEYAVAIKPKRQSTAVVQSETVYVPSVQVRSSNPVSPAASERRRVMAVFSYNNTGNNQLAFQEGDPILVIQDGQQGWQFGENLSTGKRGWYPASFTRPETESPGPPQPRPRAQSSASSATRNGGLNGYNGNGVTHSPSITNGDLGKNGKTLPAGIKQTSRPVSMMVIQNNGPATPPTYRTAPPPPPPPPPASPPGTTFENDPPIVFLDESQSKDLHMVNYDTVPKHNPFSHVRLRHVVKTDGTPKKYG